MVYKDMTNTLTCLTQNEKGGFKKMNKIPCYYIQTLASGVVSLECSGGEVLITSDYAEALDFLCHHPAGLPASAPRWVWLLSDFVKAIRELLPEQVREQFDTKNTDRNNYSATFHDRGWRNRLFFQVNKYFSINRRQEGVYGDYEVNFYELEQFAEDNHHAITSAEDLVPIMDAVAAGFASLGVPEILNGNSPVAVIESSGLLDKIYENLPNPYNIPGGVKEYAQLTNAWEAWSSAYQVGYWQEAYNYDLASAYPSVASHLVDIEEAEYKFSKTLLDDALYGFIKGTLYIDPKHPYAFASPIVHPVDDDTIGNPVGKLKGYFTLGQIRFIERQGMGCFEIDKRAGGWFVYPRTAERPLAGVMQHYYDKRSESTLMNGICKRVIAGILGRLGQFVGDTPTKYNNPVYHSTIRNETHLRVAQEIIRREIQPSELLYVHTDGFHTTKQIYMPPVAQMGKWKCEGSESVLIASPRDFVRGEKCAELVAALNKNKRSTEYPDWDIDLFKLAAEQNRYFPKYPKTGGELVKNKYQSEPVIL